MVQVNPFSPHHRQKSPEKEIPDVSKVVLAWKEIAGINGGSGWDKNLWPRHAKSAKQLIELMGTWEEAIYCIGWVWRWCGEKGLTCTIETVVKHTDTYKREIEHEKQQRVL